MKETADNDLMLILVHHAPILQGKQSILPLRYCMYIIIVIFILCNDVFDSQFGLAHEFGKGWRLGSQ